MPPLGLTVNIELGSVPALDPRNIGTRLEPHKNSMYIFTFGIAVFTLRAVVKTASCYFEVLFFFTMAGKFQIFLFSFYCCYRYTRPLYKPSQN
jgi:hypothetical protein